MSPSGWLETHLERPKILSPSNHCYYPHVMRNESHVPQWPGRLHHKVPAWVELGSVFHIRLRTAPTHQGALTDPELAALLIAAARNYHERTEWHCSLFLIMPDHIHTLLSFRGDKSMSKVVGSWKRYVTKTYGVEWQSNFFDHRIRNPDEFSETWTYILRNPVVKYLCPTEVDWRWMWRS
jgi:putative transposase